MLVVDLRACHGDFLKFQDLLRGGGSLLNKFLLVLLVLFLALDVICIFFFDQKRIHVVDALALLEPRRAGAEGRDLVAP